MKVQNKPDYLVFASDAQTGELESFPNISRGWGVTIEQTESKPPMEWMNDAFNRIDKNMLYLLQQGVPEWDSAVLYPVDAIIKHKSKLYIATIENDNAIPSANATKWTKVISDVQDGNTTQKGIVQLSSAINSDSETSAATSKAVNDVYNFIKNDSRWYSKAIGEIVAFDVDADLPPTNLSDCRYITLNINDSYNEDLLIEQIISGTAPLITATAKINFPASRLHGKVIHLINTEGRYIVASPLQHIVRDDAIQNIVGESCSSIMNYQDRGWATGAFSKSVVAGNLQGGNMVQMCNLLFNAANVVRTDTSTHGRDISRIFFMRIL